VRPSPVGKNVSTEAEDIVEIRHEVTTGGKNIEISEAFMCAAATVIFGVCNSVRVSEFFLFCSYVSVQEIKLPVQTPYIVTLYHVTVLI
jgi:hypothetical protein